MNNKISIILSTYNEGYIIKETIETLFRKYENAEVVIVDDNSSDNTVDEIKKLNDSRINLFTRKERGLASAFLLGLVNSSCEIIGWFDSNMPSLFNHIDEMLKNLENYDLVILSRFVDGGRDERRKLRVLSSKYINKLCGFILGFEIKDYTSGIFLMKRQVLKHAVPIAYGHGEFFIEFLYQLKKKNVKIKELPYIHPPDYAKMSKTAGNTLRFFRLGLYYLIRVIVSKFQRR